MTATNIPKTEVQILFASQPANPTADDLKPGTYFIVADTSTVFQKISPVTISSSSTPDWTANAVNAVSGRLVALPREAFVVPYETVKISLERQLQ